MKRIRSLNSSGSRQAFASLGDHHLPGKTILSGPLRRLVLAAWHATAALIKFSREWRLTRPSVCGRSDQHGRAARSAPGSDPLRLRQALLDGEIIGDAGERQ